MVDKIWTCSCGAYNSPDRTHCGNCGKEKKEKNLNKIWKITL